MLEMKKMSSLNTYSWSRVCYRDIDNYVSSAIFEINRRPDGLYKEPHTCKKHSITLKNPSRKNFVYSFDSMLLHKNLTTRTVLNISASSVNQSVMFYSHVNFGSIQYKEINT